MSPFFRSLITVLSLYLLIASTGHAATTATTESKASTAIDSVGVTPLVGGYLFSSSQALDSAPIYGLRLSYDHIGNAMMDSIGVEATLNYLSTTVKNSDTKASAYLFRTDAVYSFNPRSKTWVPFVALGAGGLFIDRNGVRDRSPFINFGIGLKYYFENYLSLRVDLRQLMVYENVDTNNNYELTTGLTYYFGKERKQKVAPQSPDETKPKATPAQAAEADGTDKTKPAAAAAPAVPPPSILQVLAETGMGAVGFRMSPPRFETSRPSPPKVLTNVFYGAEFQAPDAAPVALPAKAKPRPVAPVAPAPAAPAPAAPVTPIAAARVAPVPAQGSTATKVHRAVRTLTIQFQFSSPEVQPMYHAQLAAFASLMKQNAKSTAIIEGHTDNVGSQRSNLALSQQRAQNVKEELLKHGVAQDKVTIVGYGYSKPAASNKTGWGRQKNRRAMVTLTLVIEQ